MIIEEIKKLIRSHLDAIPEGSVPLICIIGPTAVGKTALSIGLAQAFNAEIISADSRQVYKGMDIGTDKITPEEMDGVPHHMLDQVEPDEAFSVFDFKRIADELIPQIYERGHIPFIVGGTMLYTDAVVNNFDFDGVKPNEELRTELQKFLDENGKEALHKRLEELDTEVAKKIHANNTHYVMRAIEKMMNSNDKQNGLANEKTQGSKSCTSTSQKYERSNNYHILKIGLMRPREEIYERINSRVEKQLEDGKLEAEAKHFIDKYGKDERSITGLGYRQFVEYLNGEHTLDDVKIRLQKETRNFAKRQIGWWKKDDSIHWFDVSRNPLINNINS
ncbi:MAG: tRNA (adenosine(37)-N6)-dimethylallyltransferase MiaA [Candidatus Gracilibacteria bacterium]|nr:tRNA (adenosine(37)-N6)-dimethylallyltransferase MiaA [Candidatus Gracilibacteria bacterium]